LIKAHPDILGALDKQRQALLRIALKRMRCPECRAAVNQIEAAGVDLDAFDVDGVRTPPMACPLCKTPLRVVVPAFGAAFGGSSYRWER
jgi:hypothetical protein